jgi:hypothetical protein
MFVSLHDYLERTKGQNGTRTIPARVPAKARMITSMSLVVEGTASTTRFSRDRTVGSEYAACRPDEAMDRPFPSA